jgi:hypothetical protein
VLKNTVKNHHLGVKKKYVFNTFLYKKPLSSIAANTLGQMLKSVKNVALFQKWPKNGLAYVLFWPKKTKSCTCF